MLHRSLLLLCALLLWCCVQRAEAQSDQEIGRELSAEFWRDLLRRHESSADEADPHVRWGDIASHGVVEFEKLVLKTPDLKASIEFLVNRFGEKGPEADLCWYLALEPYAAPKFNAVKPIEGNTDRKAVLRRASFLMAELQVRRFCRDHELLLRYQHVLSWRRLWLDGGSNGQNKFIIGMNGVKERLDKLEDDYWWHCRNFLVLAATTGRMDLVPSTYQDAKKCGDAMGKWLEWFEENGSYLRPEVLRPRWSIDRELQRVGYGYVKFWTSGVLPPLIYDAPTPFPDWPASSLPRDVAL